MAMIACVDLDPFLVGLVQRVRPDDEVVMVAPEALTSRRSRRFGSQLADRRTREGGRGPARRGNLSLIHI